MWKSKKVKKVETKLNNQRKEDIDDLILILNQIRETNNESIQWKRKQLIINNTIDCTKERLEQKKMEIGD